MVGLVTKREKLAEDLESLIQRLLARQMEKTSKYTCFITPVGPLTLEWNPNLQCARMDLR